MLSPLARDYSPRVRRRRIAAADPRSQEARALFDAESQKLMGMSGEEFLRRYDAGEFDDILDDSEHLEIMRLAMMRSFAR